MHNNNLEKKYTKNELLQQLGIQSYILTLWEQQFNIVAENVDGHRYYSIDNFEKLRSIKELIYNNGYTIETAKKHLITESTSPHRFENLESLKIIRIIPSQKAKLLDESSVTQLLSLREQLKKLRELL